ncbi:PqqD family protein [Roseivirga sp. E12]|uniref:PqqD family protein n=1 Tax=Roseivirga sp. E12 TaxID=2819237 RepID=UPI001ABC6E25|nr:PqqD family protein [Roseivirga sp. E12]MBO3699060.1 PqqD family protein [Roseivirga sp. E12]
MEIKGDTLLKKSDDLIEASLGESLALMSIESGKYFGMNQVAKYVWQAMNEEVSFDDLISKLISTFDIDTATCANDCRNFIQELHQKNMVLVR